MNWEWKKRGSSIFGCVFAKKAGIQSHTLLGMVMRGAQPLGEDDTCFCARDGPKPKKHFLRTRQFHQAKIATDRQRTFLCSRIRQSDQRQE